MALRILASFILVLSVLFMPFWVSVVLGLGFVLYFPLYFEVLIIFFLSDLLHGVGVPKLFGITYASFIVGLIIFAFAQYARKETKFYSVKLKK